MNIDEITFIDFCFLGFFFPLYQVSMSSTVYTKK